MNDHEKALVAQLKGPLLAMGFNWVKAREAFVRTEAYGFSCFSWTSYPRSDHGGGVAIGPVLGVRHDRVDGVVNKLGLVLGERNMRNTTTVSRGLEFYPFSSELWGGSHYIRSSHAEADVRNAASAIGQMMVECGLDFFERYSSILECSIGLNEPVNSLTHPLCNNFPRRAYYGIGAAFFSERDRVPGLVSGYLDFARSETPAQYQKIEGRMAQLVAAAEGSLSSG